MRIIYFGNGMRGLKCLQALLETKHDVAAVVGHPGEKSEMVVYAQNRGMDVYQPSDVNAPEFLASLEKIDAELFILSGYNRIFKKEIIQLPSRGCINLHGGKLPEYRGAAPINWQIIKGETTGGCCILFVDEGIDTGNVIVQHTYEILADDTSVDIVEKQLKLFPHMLLDVIERFQKGEVRGIPQDDSLAHYYPKRYPQDSLMDFKTMKACDVHNFVRALVDPYPNAFSYLNGEKIRIRKVKLVDVAIETIPGKVLKEKRQGVLVGCQDKAILVTEVALGEGNPALHPVDILKLGSQLEIK